MTEINLAQKKLLEDEGWNGDSTHLSRQNSALQRSLPPVSFSIDDQRYLQETAQQGHGAFRQGNGHFAIIVDSRIPEFTEQHEEVTRYEVPHQNTGFDRDIDESAHTSSHDEHYELATSYNYFESSLKGSMDPVNAENTTITGTVENEYRDGLQRTPVRPRSMQMTSYSPHDTEPFSSLVLPGLNRAKSDDASGLVHQEEQLSQRSMRDELAVPVTIEIPITKKTLVHKTNENVPEDGDDDELALSEVHEHAKENDEHKQQQNTEAVSDVGLLNAAPEIEAPREVSIVLPMEQTAGSPEFFLTKQKVHIAEPTKPTPKTRGPKKKKLKRGKTTSVALKRTYESDVEDDVIWIDEKPLHPELQNNDLNDDHQKSFSESNRPGQDKEKLGSESITNSTTSQIQPGESKKRGRKRKKTAEQVQNNEDDKPRIGEVEATSNNILQDISNTANTANCDQDHDPSKENKEKSCISNQTAEGSFNSPTIHEEQSDPSSPTKVDDNPSLTAPTEPPTLHESVTPKKHQQQRQQKDLNNQPEIRSNSETSLDLGKGTPGKDPRKGPDKHSPISTTSRVPFRVGLSRRARIAPLLKIVKR